MEIQQIAKTSSHCKKNSRNCCQQNWQRATYARTSHHSLTTDDRPTPIWYMPDGTYGGIGDFSPLYFIFEWGEGRLLPAKWICPHLILKCSVGPVILMSVCRCLLLCKLLLRATIKNGWHFLKKIDEKENRESIFRQIIRRLFLKQS